MKKLLLGGVFVVLAAPTFTIAAPSAAVRAACHEDARRVCGAVFGNPGAVQACMREHRAELSEGCKAAMAQAHHQPTQGQARGGKAQCLAEAEKLFPSGVRATTGKLANHYESYVRSCMVTRSPQCNGTTGCPRLGQKKGS
jgi:hypothetical protein